MRCSRHRVHLALTFAALSAGALAAACRGADEPRRDQPDPPAPPPDAAAPATSAPSSPDSASAAVAVVRDYYAAIRAHDYARAYALWPDEGRGSGQRFEEFRRGFAETASVELTVATPGRVEGAAGSRYVEIPVRLAARQRDGTVRHYRGEYVVRRSVVPGATSAQRRWHLYAARLTRVD